MRQIVELNYELPDYAYVVPRDYKNRKGEVTADYYQRFELQPNTYIFCLGIKLSEHGLKDSRVKFRMKVGSTSECKIEEIKHEK